MKLLLLCALILAGVGCGCRKPPVDVDALNRAEQARLQAQADKEREAQKP